ncbi:hypothetical protein ACO1BR_42475 [Streptomyces sp. YGL11-2]
MSLQAGRGNTTSGATAGLGHRRLCPASRTSEHSSASWVLSWRWLRESFCGACCDQCQCDLAYDVAWAHTRSATVPDGTAVSDLAKGLVEPRLLDRLGALGAAVQRQHEMDLDRSEDL